MYLHIYFLTTDTLEFWYCINDKIMNLSLCKVLVILIFYFSRVAFPEILNLNSFIASEGNKEESECVPEESVVKCDDSSTTDSGSALDDESCQGIETVLTTQEAEYQVNCILVGGNEQWSYII